MIEDFVRGAVERLRPITEFPVVFFECVLAERHASEPMAVPCRLWVVSAATPTELA